MDAIGVKARELYQNNINELIEFIRFFIGKEDEEIEKMYIQEYESVVQEFVTPMLTAFPEEKLSPENTNFWLTHGVNLTFEQLYDKHADKLFLQRDLGLNGTVYINSNTGMNASSFTVTEGRVTKVENLSVFLLGHSYQFRTRYRLNITERHFLGRHIEAVYDELEALNVLEENSELKRIISIRRQQKELVRNFHISVIYTLLMQEHGNYNLRRAMLFDKFVNLGFDFEQLYNRKDILSLKYPHKEFNDD